MKPNSHVPLVRRLRINVGVSVFVVWEGIALLLRLFPYSLSYTLCNCVHTHTYINTYIYNHTHIYTYIHKHIHT